MVIMVIAWVIYGQQCLLGQLFISYQPGRLQSESKVEEEHLECILPVLAFPRGAEQDVVAG